MSWLDLVPASDTAYAFRAALLCEDCGTDLIKKIQFSGVIDDGDSNTFPQGPYPNGGGETDSPLCCDNHADCLSAVSVGNRLVGCPIKCQLTQDGVLYLRQTIYQDLASTKKFERMMGRLLARVWSEYAEPSECLAPWSSAQLAKPLKVPPTLAKTLRTTGISNARPVALDTANIYLISPKSEAAYLIRAPADDDGNFEVISSVTIPIAASYDPYKLIAEAVSDGAWD